MPLQVWRMLQKPLCGNQMNLATLNFNTMFVVTQMQMQRMDVQP